MVQVVDGCGRRVWVTGRDERVCQWLRIVRVCDVQAIRWILGALNGSGGPVSARSAQSWCARMELVGLIGRKNLGGPGGSYVWGTDEATGLPAHVNWGIVRHEVAVAAISARYIAAGFAWRRDDAVRIAGDHRADGVALGLRSTELIEVELTPKRTPRYALIFGADRRRLDRGDADRIAYLCTEPAARVVQESLKSTTAGRSVARSVSVRTVFGGRGEVLS